MKIINFKWLLSEVIVIFIIVTTVLSFKYIKEKHVPLSIITNVYDIKADNMLETSQFDKKNICTKEEINDLLIEEILMQKKIKELIQEQKEIKNIEVLLEKNEEKFIIPTNGQLTSRYGPRQGSFHTGIDLASRAGTPIKASATGIVVFAGYKGSYGYMVEICHSDGYNTRYAHCSKLYVKVGEKVYKNKKIGAVGNTGRSTGPHVHFEILKHGKHQNPLQYIK